MLQITPDYYLDTKEVTFKNLYGLDYHFDEHGFMRPIGGKAPADITLSKSDSTKKVYIMIPYQTFIGMSPADWQKWQNEKVAELFYKKLETSANYYTTYGTPRKGKILKPGAHVVKYNDPSYIFFSGTWSKSANCECAFSKAKGDFIEVTFNSNSIKVVGEKTTTHGKVIIELDGVNVDTVNLYNASIIKPFTIYEKQGLEDKQHTLRLIVMEGKYVVFSKIEVSNIETEKTDTVYIEKIVEKEIVKDSLISNHNDFHNAVEKAVGIDLTRSGYYEVWQRPDGSKYIIQPKIEIE